VNAILESMKWLGLDWTKGRFFQMKRLPRYQEAADKLIAAGHAYPAGTKEELEELRTRQRKNNEKPRYDGRWRPERAAGIEKTGRGQAGHSASGRRHEGEVGWNDLVKPDQLPQQGNWTTWSCCARTAYRPTTSAWWSTISTWTSRT